MRKRQRRLTGVDEIVLSLSAKGLTTGEIAGHFDDVYGAKVSKGTISRIAAKIISRTSTRPLGLTSGTRPPTTNSHQDRPEAANPQVNLGC